MKTRSVRTVLTIVAVFLAACVPSIVLGAGICVQDQFGEKIHLDVHPGGQLTGYAENPLGKIVGTAFGSYKVLSDSEVMIGGDVNNECLAANYTFTGKFIGTINVKDNTGAVTGYVFSCGDPWLPVPVVAFSTPLVPCGDSPGRPAKWGEFFEQGKK